MFESVSLLEVADRIGNFGRVARPMVLVTVVDFHLSVVGLTKKKLLGNSL